MSSLKHQLNFQCFLLYAHDSKWNGVCHAFSSLSIRSVVLQVSFGKILNPKLVLILCHPCVRVKWLWFLIYVCEWANADLHCKARCKSIND